MTHSRWPSLVRVRDRYVLFVCIFYNFIIYYLIRKQSNTPVTIVPSVLYCMSLNSDKVLTPKRKQWTHWHIDFGVCVPNWLQLLFLRLLSFSPTKYSERGKRNSHFASNSTWKKRTCVIYYNYYNNKTSYNNSYLQPFNESMLPVQDSDSVASNWRTGRFTIRAQCWSVI